MMKQTTIRRGFNSAKRFYRLVQETHQAQHAVLYYIESKQSLYAHRWQMYEPMGITDNRGKALRIFNNITSL